MTEHTHRQGLRIRRRRPAAIAGGLAAAFLATIAASAGAHSFDQPDRVIVSTSGNNSELVTSLPIETAPGPGTVVMSLPFKGQPLQAGDGLSSSSELQVTTDCSASGDDCVGTPYTYKPQIDTRLILTSSADPSGSGGTAVTLAQETRRTCTQAQHHCVIVFPFPDSPFQVSSPAPSCMAATDGCRLNVVVSAYNAQAQPTDRLIVGENEPGCCGITAQDKGRVNAVRLRPVVPGPEPSGSVTTYLTSNLLVTSVPVRDTVSEGKTVVLSQPLDKLRKNEQLAVSANVTADISGLTNYNRALIHSQLILADSRRATSSSSTVKQLEELKGEIDEANGSNCTQNQPDPADNTNPCTTLKTGVAHLIQNAGGRLFVNLVVSATPAKTRTVQPGDAVSIKGGALKVVRYPASRYG
jgi:hypothetical protein